MTAPANLVHDFTANARASLKTPIPPKSAMFMNGFASMTSRQLNVFNPKALKRKAQVRALKCVCGRVLFYARR